MLNFMPVAFAELYRRHLCRHSQFGINVWHLVAVVGIYVSLFSIALALPGARWAIGAALAVYFALLGPNLSGRLILATVAAIAALLAVALLLPSISPWIHAVLILAWHKFQVWNHRVFDHHDPMDEFAERYQKGPRLFLLLALYELPILLNFFMTTNAVRFGESSGRVAASADIARAD